MPERSGAPSRRPRFDFAAGIVVLIALSLAVFGLVVQTSAGQYMRESMRLTHDPLYTFRMQLLFLLPALGAGFIFACVNLRWLRRQTWWIFAGACVLLICARFALPGVKFFGATFPGVEVNGSWNEKIRWLRPGSLLLPSAEARADFMNGFLKPLAIIGAICGLVAAGPDLGTTALCGVVGMTMLFLSGGRLRYIVPVAFAGVAAFSAVVFFWPNRLARVLAFLDPEGTRLREGYQLWQALVGFGCGGVSGSGLGGGVQYRYFLPEAHTDFVFAVVGEELGFFWTAGVAAVFLALFFVALGRIRRIPDVFHFNLCLGSLLFVTLQALVNMGVVTGLLPTKGMSLPFVSYGGSNLVVMFSFVGIIFNAMRNWRGNVFPPPPDLPAGAPLREGDSTL